MRIGIDLDGVIVDSIRYWVRVLNRELGTHYHAGDLPDPYATAELAACCDRHELEMLIAPPPMTGAVAGVSHLKELGHTLIVVTARAPRLRPLTEAWLTYYGLRVDDLHFLEGGSKVPVAQAQGLDLMVEDAPHNATALAQGGVPVLLFGAPYNDGIGHERIQRCANWNDVLARIRSETAVM